MFLQNYHNFLDNLAKSNDGLVHFGSTAMHYFYMAESEVEAFEDSCKQYINIDMTRNGSGLYIKAQAHCFGFYMLIRTCINAAYRLSEQLQKSDVVEKYKDNWRQYIKEEIMDKSNDMIIHPLEKDNKDKFFEAGGLDISGIGDQVNGKVNIYEWNLNGGDPTLKLVDVNPRETLQRVFEYLEGLGNVYNINLHSQSKK